jgi:hypothetical protein
MTASNAPFILPYITAKCITWRLSQWEKQKIGYKETNNMELVGIIIVAGALLLWVFGVPIALISIAVTLKNIHEAMTEPIGPSFDWDAVSLKNAKIVETKAEPAKK